MNNLITIKTRSLYQGHYDFEDDSHSNFLTFTYSSSANDEEIERHFRRVVYKAEYGEVLTKRDCPRVEIYEMREAHDYSQNKNLKISLS